MFLRKIFLILVVTLFLVCSLNSLSLLAESFTYSEENNAINNFSNFIYEKSIAQSSSSLPVPSRPPEKNFWQWITSLGRRGTCSDLNPPLMTFLPPQTEVENKDYSIGLTSGLGLTASQYPTLWIYLPSLKSKIKYAEFELQDSRGNRQTVLIQLPGSAGIFGLPLSSTQISKVVKGLEVVDELYQWNFSVICDARRPSRNATTGAGIKRKKVQTSNVPTSETMLPIAGEEQLRRYASNNVWYETLTMTAELHCKNREESRFKNYWSKLVKNEFLSERDISIQCSSDGKPKLLEAASL